MSEPDPRITSFLLGELAEAERDEFERDFFTDARVFERLVVAETDLIDDYVRHRLSPEIEERFERHYLADPHRRARVDVADALVARLDARSSTTRPTSDGDSPVDRPAVRGRAWRLTMALATAALALVTVGLLVETARLRRGLNDVQSAKSAVDQRERDLQDQLARERARARELASELDRVRAASPADRATASIVALTLSLRASRGADSGPPPTLAIGPDTKEARVDITVDGNDYARYRLSLNDVAGTTLIASEHVAASGSRLRLVVPAERLAEGDYVITVSGEGTADAIDALGKILVRVVRK